MEFLPALPPDFAAVVDPSVRGAAPLLAPTEGDDTAALGATPFELCLALLTPPLPAGQGLPPAGNELPPVPLDAAGEAAPDAAGAATFMLALTPAAAAVQARLAAAELPQASSTADASLAASRLIAAGAPLPSLTQPLSAAGSSTEQPPLATPTAAAEAAAAPAPLFSAAAGTDFALGQEPVEPLSADGAAQPGAEPPPFDDRGFERPAAHRAEPRASVATTLPQPAALPQQQAVAAATPTAEAGAVVQSASRRIELQPAVQPAGASADGAGVSLPDWLPAPGAGGNSAQALHSATPPAPGAPVDTRSPTWHEAFASRVQWLVDHDVGEAHIKLNPPELGAVDVKISLVDDKTFVQLTTATVGARDELQQSLPRLRELFAGAGLELGGASVQNGRAGQQSPHGHGDGPAGGAAEGRARRSFSSLASEPRVGLQRPSLGRIDLFA